MAVAIIDFGMGNLKSVANAVHSLGSQVFVAKQPEELSQADRIILPGVGAFRVGMENLNRGGWIPALEQEVLASRKPFLGICLGMQLLATTGSEHGSHAGLGWVEGQVERLDVEPYDVRLPHIGWNDVEQVRQGGLYDSVEDNQTYYFVHSYAFRPTDEDVVTGVTSHGERFASSLEKDNIYATQFHPEKSQQAGLHLLNNFLQRAA